MELDSGLHAIEILVNSRVHIRSELGRLSKTVKGLDCYEYNTMVAMSFITSHNLANSPPPPYISLISDSR